MNVPPFILTYHSVDPSGSVISVNPASFRLHMAELAAGPFKVVPLAEAGKPGTVALTFDDGFRNFFEISLPILLAYRFPATVFVVTGHSGRVNNWGSSAASGIPTLPLMNWSELREVARLGFSLGAHTVSHPRLTRLSRAQALRELGDSQKEIENRVGRRVDTFAYPYGDMNRRVREMVSSRFRFACTTDLRFLGSDRDPLALPRLDAYYFRKPLGLTELNSQVVRCRVAARRLLRGMRTKLYG